VWQGENNLSVLRENFSQDLEWRGCCDPSSPAMPTPKACAIVLSSAQQELLEQIVRQTTNPYRLVRRAQLILAAARGCTNTQISDQLQLDRAQVRLWRQRWLDAQEQLADTEASEAAEIALRDLVLEVLSDETRPGTPSQFSLEQVVQIVALACEDPQQSGRAISEWSVRELADEAIQRGIVEQISPRSVGRFLKRSQFATASHSVLAQRSTRRPRSVRAKSEGSV
jgi:putative transposase